MASFSQVYVCEKCRAQHVQWVLVEESTGGQFRLFSRFSLITCLHVSGYKVGSDRELDAGQYLINHLAEPCIGPTLTSPMGTTDRGGGGGDSSSPAASGGPVRSPLPVSGPLHLFLLTEDASVRELWLQARRTMTNSLSLWRASAPVSWDDDADEKKDSATLGSKQFKLSGERKKEDDEERQCTCCRAHPPTSPPQLDTCTAATNEQQRKNSGAERRDETKAKSAERAAVVTASTMKTTAVLVVSKMHFSKVLMEFYASFLRGDYIPREPLHRCHNVMSLVSNRQPMILFFGGTSGSGKSTLAALVAQRLGIASIISTDTVREIVRAHTRKEECPELFSSTYEAHEAGAELFKERYENLSFEEKVVVGYKKQSNAVLQAVDVIVQSFVRRNESLVIEGVHLLPNYLSAKVKELTLSEVSCVPLIVYIHNEAKHKERFAIRAKSMTLLSNGNKYVQHFQAIRCIQRFLTQPEWQQNVVMVNNTNVDRSVARIHVSILSSFDLVYGTPVRSLAKQKAVGSKEALQNILQRKLDKRKARTRSVENYGVGRSGAGSYPFTGLVQRGPSSPPTLRLPPRLVTTECGGGESPSLRKGDEGAPLSGGTGKEERNKLISPSSRQLERRDDRVAEELELDEASLHGS